MSFMSVCIFMSSFYTCLYYDCSSLIYWQSLNSEKGLIDIFCSYFLGLGFSEHIIWGKLKIDALSLIFFGLSVAKCGWIFWIWVGCSSPHSAANLWSLSLKYRSNLSKWFYYWAKYARSLSYLCCIGAMTAGKHVLLAVNIVIFFGFKATFYVKL